MLQKLKMLPLKIVNRKGLTLNLPNFVITKLMIHAECHVNYFG